MPSRSTRRAPRTPSSTRHAPPRSRAVPPVTKIPEPATPDRILTTALAEFAEHGFAGARVDRMARKARLNKAMLYYHFGSKAKLYRATIQRMLENLAERLETIARAAEPADAKLDRFIETFVSMGLTEPAIAPIMLREVVEGAGHFDKDTFALLARIVGTMTVIVQQGQREGAFRDVNPLLTYLTTVWPIMVYLASGSLRASISRHTGLDTSAFEPHHFVRHMQQMSRQALAVPARVTTRPSDTIDRHTEHAT